MYRVWVPPSPITPCSIRISFLLLVAGFALAHLSQPALAAITTSQVTSGNTSGLANISIGTDSSSSITYVDHEGSGLWGAGLGLAVYSKSGSQTRHCAPLLTLGADTLSGQALPLPAASGGVLCFQHRGYFPSFGSSQEWFELLHMGTSCSIGDEATVTPEISCVNVDNWQAGARLSDGTYGLLYSSCQGTGTDQTDRNNLYYSRWNSDGTPAGSQKLLVSSQFVREGRVAIIAEASAIHVFYVDWRSGKDVLYAQKIDYAGSVLAGEKAVARGGSIGGLRIDAAAEAGGILHAVWSENRTGSAQLFETRVSQNCDSLGAATQVTFSTGAATNPRIRIDRMGFIHWVWTDTRHGHPNVYYRATCCTPEETLIADTLVSTLGTDVKMADMDVDGRLRARVAWTTGTTSVHGNVFYTIVDLIAPRLAVGPAVRPLAMTLRAAPNPFVAGARITYELNRSTAIELSVFDIEGRRLASLGHGSQTAGVHSVAWAGLNERGIAMPSGVYRVRLEADGQVREIRIAEIR